MMVFKYAKAAIIVVKHVLVLLVINVQLVQQEYTEITSQELLIIIVPVKSIILILELNYVLYAIIHVLLANPQIHSVV